MKFSMMIWRKRLFFILSMHLGLPLMGYSKKFLLEVSGERGRVDACAVEGSHSMESDRVVGVRCGRYIEITIHPERVHSGHSSDSGDGACKVPESEESILARSISRSQRRIRRLCNANNMWYMHTMTFAVSPPKYFKGEKKWSLIPLEQQKDRGSVILLWKQFARKMRRKSERKGEYFRYIAVIERHTGKRKKGDRTVKEGCYHVHFVSDKLYQKRLLQSVWGHGLCNFSDWTKGRKKRDLDEQDSLPPPDNPGAYISKYIGKDVSGEYPGKKRYWASRNLLEPEKIVGNHALCCAVGAQEIYRKVQKIPTKGDDRFIERISLTYLLPENCANKLPSLRDTKRSKRAIEYKRFVLHDRLVNRYEEGKNLHRETDKNFVDSALKRMWTHRQEARNAVRDFGLESLGNAPDVRGRLHSVKTRKRQSPEGLIGCRLRKFWKKRAKGTENRTVFHSYSCSS